MKLKGLLAMLMTIALLIGMVPAVMSEGEYEHENTMFVKANTKKVKMYSEMSTKSSVVTKVPVGKKVTCYNLTVRAKWVTVSWNGYYGFMQTKFLVNKKPKPTPKPTKKPSPVVTHKPGPKAVTYEEFTNAEGYVQVKLASSSGRMNMRYKPSTESDVVGVYPNGSVFKLLMESKSWYEVLDEEDNRVGYMSRKYLGVIPDPHVNDTPDLELDSELVVSPMNNVSSLEALRAAVPDVYIPEHREGATDVVFDWIEGEPVIAQIIFDIEDDMYCLRAAHCADEESVIDIDGVYTPLHEEISEDDIHVVFDDEHTIAAAHYFSAEHETQYTLIGSAEDGGAKVLALAKGLFLAVSTAQN